MKKITYFASLMAFAFVIFIAAPNTFAQDAPKSAAEKHVCTDACKDGCTAMAKTDKSKMTKDECKAKTAMKDADGAEMSEKHVCTAECKEKGCETVMKEAAAKKVSAKMSAIDVDKDGFVYQCSMHCSTQTSDAADECEVCGMKLAKYSLEDAGENFMKSMKSHENHKH